MTNPAILSALAATAVIAALGVMVIGLRLRARRLERMLDDVTARLEQLHVQFARFAPEDVIERLTLSSQTASPARRPVTMLFADLQGFTAMCDRFDPMSTVSILNGYFRSMSEAIGRHHGRINELVGDGLLAFFGALETNPWQARDAVLSALKMRAALARYNGGLRERGLPELRFGIGIHSGEVVAGVLGTEELSKFGVVGDPINVASRVEGLTRVHGVDLLITEDVRKGLDGNFRLRSMPAAAVKGKAEPIVTYHVEGLKTEGAPDGGAREAAS